MSSFVPIFNPGVGNTICWGLNRPLGSGIPPQFLTVWFDGIEKSSTWSAGDGEPLNGYYTLDQLIFGEVWDFGAFGDLFMFLKYDFQGTEINFVNEFGKQIFLAFTSRICITHLENEAVGPFENGFAELIIPRE